LDLSKFYERELDDREKRPWQVPSPSQTKSGEQGEKGKAQARSLHPALAFKLNSQNIRIKHIKDTHTRPVNKRTN
jgi:hypothetical protein